MVASALSGTALGPVIYQRRQPEKLVLWQAEAHLPGFLAAACEAERPVPELVRRELEAFLDAVLAMLATLLSSEP